MSKSVTSGRATSSKLAEAHMALLDIQGICELLQNEQSIDEIDFPQPVAAAIRMMRMRADYAVLAIETERQP